MTARLGLAGAWGITGVLGVLVEAVVRLVPRPLALADREPVAIEWGALVGCVAVLGYLEGYRGFHRRFSPRVVARALHLTERRDRWLVALAPLYCMGLVHATRRRLVTNWILTLGIVALVVAVRQLADPWRGIVDAGVAIALGCGIASILYYLGVALAGRPIAVPPDLPE